MDANPEVFTASNQEGIERVQGSRGKYAFFMESSSIEYIMERHCDLAKVGGELDAKSYGIGGRFLQNHYIEDLIWSVGECTPGLHLISIVFKLCCLEVEVNDPES